MRTSLKGLLAAVVMAAVVTTAMAASDHEGWNTSFAKAAAEAKKAKKPMIVLFTGSDWCPPCMALEKNVFDSDEFKSWAKENAVLVMLDYPRSKAQDSATKAQNKELGKKYKIQGYPTVIVMDAAGKEADRFVGYGGDQPSAWIKKAQGAIAKLK